MSNRALAFGLVALTLASPVRADDRVLVVIAPDGLRGDVLQRLRPDGSAVAPRLAAWAATAFVAADVETASPDPVLGMAGLLTAGDAVDLVEATTPWASGRSVVIVADRWRRHAAESVPARGVGATFVACAEEGFASVLDSLSTQGPWPDLLVFAGRGLGLPWSIDDPGLLHTMDPTPWRGGEAERTMAGQIEARAAAARAFLDRASLDGVGGGTFADCARAYDATLAQWDARLGTLLEAIDRVLGARSVIVVTATRGFGLGGVESLGVGNDVRREQVHIPFLVRGGPAGRSETTAPLGAWLATVDAFCRGGSWTPPAQAPYIGLAWPEAAAPRVRIRDGGASLVFSPGGEGAVFDRSVDPRERVDVGALEPARRQQLHALAMDRLGDTGSLVLRIEASDQPELIEFTLRGVGDAAGLQTFGLEPIDAAHVVDGVLHLALVTDPEGDAIAIPLAADVAGLEGSVRRDALADDAGPFAWRFGPTQSDVGDHAEVWRLGPRWVASWTSSPIDSLVAISRGRGIDVWIRRQP